MTALDKPITRPPWEPASRRDYALSLCRIAYLNARLACAETETIATALRSNSISPEVAIAWLGDAALAYDPYYDAPAAEAEPPC
jgi:hypothetical protein